MDPLVSPSADLLTATLTVPEPLATAAPIPVATPVAAIPLIETSPAPELFAKVSEPIIQSAAPEPAAPEPPQDALQPTPKAENSDEPPAPPSKMLIVAKALRTIEQSLSNIIRLLEEGNGEAHNGNGNGNGNNGFAGLEVGASALRDIESSLMKAVDGRVVEGVFDGTQMVGSDGKTYMVPANYASKSKLVEGDMLKLTITAKGSFIYKQIGPIERSRVIANLGFDQTIGEFYATADNRRWAVLKASVTYFRGEPGDEVVLLVPKANPSKWAAVENIIKRDPLAGV